VITTESVHCPHLPGFVRSDVESCHGRIEQISPQRNSSCAHLPLEDDLSSSHDICDQGDDSLDSFSGFLDPGGRFAITTESVHCPHLPGFVRSDVESKRLFPLSLPCPLLGACIWKVNEDHIP
jgi:hypothetical protein